MTELTRQLCIAAERFATVRCQFYAVVPEYRPQCHLVVFWGADNDD